jgi:hypothetical protein
MPVSSRVPGPCVLHAPILGDRVQVSKRTRLSRSPSGGSDALRPQYSVLKCLLARRQHGGSLLDLPKQLLEFCRTTGLHRTFVAFPDVR